MRKFLVCGLLLGALALLSGSTSPAVAQKKDVKGGVIEVNQSEKDKKFRFVIRDSNGKLLAMSGPTGYETEQAALKVVEDLKAVLKTAKVKTKKAGKGGK